MASHRSTFPARLATGFLLLATVAMHAAAAPFATIAPSQVNPDRNSFFLYVSTEGNDAWSGSQAEPNAAKTDGPMKTIGQARDRVAQMRAMGGITSAITILIRGGVYPQAQPLVFAPADSGTKGRPVTYQAYPGEVPIISGGLPITGWKADGNLWKAQVPKLPDGKPWSFNQLVVNGQRRTRARTPNRGEFLRTDGPISKDNNRGFRFRKGDLKRWPNLNDAIVVVYHSWETSLHHIRRVDEEYGEVTFRESAPWPMGRWEKYQRYYVENVFEALDSPGEWYLDRAKSVVYYYPMPGETPDTIEAIAPRLTTTLVEFRGEPGKNQYVDFLAFRGLSFQHTNAKLEGFRNPGQGEIYQGGMIMANGLRGSIFESCEIAHAGGHGIWLAGGCVYNRVERVHIHDMAGGGVYIGGGWGVNESGVVGQNVVDNCFIHEGGNLFHGAHGVWIGKSSYNKVTHNEISNLDYSGISCGWSWGFQPSTANHNNLDNNHIHHLSNGEGLSDMGGIYTLGVSPGTTERGNRIHDVYNYAHVSHGSGIYPDEGSTEILIENNIVYRVATCPLFMHYGKECTVRNNILAFGGKGQLRRSREDKRCHYIAERNIIYGDKPEMLDGPWKNGDWQLDRNLYWSTAGAPTFAGMSFAEWQAKGNDQNSMVADPLFADPENGDFTLPRESPAYKAGFSPFSMNESGLYGAKEWVSLPAQYTDRAYVDVPKPDVPPFILNLDFEAATPGAEPFDGSIANDGTASSIEVSDATAASGNQSLRFTDAEGLPHSWMPHIFYKKTYTEGKIHASWDMLNTKEAPASFYIELRQYDGGKFVIGPTMSVSPTGEITASKKPIGSMPLGVWTHVDIQFELGPNDPQTYELTVSAPGHAPRTATLPYVSKDFHQVTWMGISSTSDKATTFYVDNLKMGTAEDLAKPIVRAPRRPQTAKPQEPPNADKLVGYWKLDEGGGSIAEDKSGCQNEGDMWANWSTAALGSAMRCDAVDSYMAIADSPTLRLGKSDFTIELWLYPTQLDIDSTQKRRRFLSKSDYPKTWVVLDVTTDGKISTQMTDAAKVSFSATGRGQIHENQWAHVAVVGNRKRGDVSFYINGILDSLHGVPPALGSLDVEGKELTIGSTWQPFIGLIDEVKIYKRALSPEEIEASYSKQKAMHSGTNYKAAE